MRKEIYCFRPLQGAFVTEENTSRPAIGVAAVIWKGDHLLLVQRGKEPRKGEWSLPGGHQEWGETVTQAVEREIKEETGLSVQVSGLIDVVDAIIPGTDGLIEQHFTLIDFRCEWLAGEAVAGDDATAVRWVTLRETESIDLWEETRRIISMSISDGAERGHQSGKL